MGDYVASLTRLLALGPRSLWPGHGAPVEDGAGRLRALLAHRREREAAVLDALAQGPATAEEMLDAIYRALPSGLRGAARRNLLAHLVDLSRRGLAAPVGELSESAAFRRVDPADSPLDAGKPHCYSAARGPA
jgi:glyoxylase-like metal-dependent hydrolase (beta-lactamase superfamily II)